MKNLSIITMFGCPYTCSFCISDAQNSKHNYKIDLKSIDIIGDLLKSGNYERVSISGGGDPMHIHNSDIEMFHTMVLGICGIYGVPLSIHTNYNKINPKLEYLSEYYDHFVVSINHINYKEKFKNWSNYNVRFAYVSVGSDIDIIQEIIAVLPDNSKFTIKQLYGTNKNDYNQIIYLLNTKNDTRLRFLETGDYNTYFNLEDNKIYDTFIDIPKTKLN